MNNHPWTDQEVDILRKLSARALTDAQIHEVLIGRSINAISNKRSELGITYYKSLSPGEIDLKAFERLMKGGK